MKYICSWSGGKDSSCSILLAHLLGEPLDTIIFAEAMFDRNKGISAENPIHIQWMKSKIPLFESWGYEVKILHSDTDYLEIFHHVIEKPRLHICNQGKKYGFMCAGKCSLKRECKIRPINRYLESLKEPYVQYVGICSDESRRLKSLHNSSTQISILEKFGITQKTSRALCEEYDLLSSAYKLSNRNGCWLCPFASEAEHRYIFSHDRETWDAFVNLESLGKECMANDRWNVFGESLKERNERFIAQENC